MSEGTNDYDAECTTCWICLEAAYPDNPLRRDCTCRGSSGFAHISCLVSYAKHESTKYDDDILQQRVQASVTEGLVQKCSIKNFTSPWTTCPNCCHKYKNKLAEELADAFTDFATAHRYHGNALVRLILLSQGSRSTTQQRRSDEKEKLSLVWELQKKNLDPISQLFLTVSFEVEAHLNLGSIYYEEYEHDITNQAILTNARRHLKKCKEISKGLGPTTVGFMAEIKFVDVSEAISKIQGKSHNPLPFAQERISATKNMYEYSVKRRLQWSDPEWDEQTIQCGLHYTHSLRNGNASQVNLAKTLSAQLALESMQLLGPDHELTVDSKYLLEEVQNLK